MTNCVVISYRRLSISELFHLKWHGPDRPCHSSATTLAGHGAEMKIRKPRSRWADDVRPEKIMKTYTRICTFFCSLHVSGYQKLGTLAKKCMYCLARHHAARGGSQKRYTRCRGWIAICVSHYRFLLRDAMYSADYAVARCLLTVCPSVCHTPVLCRNGELFSPPSSHTILHVVLPHLTLRQYIDGNIPSGRGGGFNAMGLETKGSAVAERTRDVRVIEYFAESLKVIRNGTIRKLGYGFIFTFHSWVGCVAQLVERRSLTGELSLSCARPAADGWPLMWVNRPL